MFTSYFKITWRNLLKDRQFTFLNLMGLATGLACTILIYLWVNDEMHVDKFNKNDDRLFQVLKTSPNSDGTVSTWESTQGLLAKSMAEDIPEIEYAVSVRHDDHSGIISLGDKHIKALPQFAGKDFFNVFSYQTLQKNTDWSRVDKNAVFLSDKLAMKLFNTTKNIIGKTILWDEGGEFNGSYAIAGIYKAPPQNASHQFDILFTYELFFEKETPYSSDWGSNNVNTYLVLRKGTNPKEFSSKIKDFTKIKIKNFFGNGEALKWEGDILIQRYSDRYLYNSYENGVQSGGRIEYVRLFTIIAIFILVIACINFMNLSTAKASRRLKEIGIKKVVGASRVSLILQYMGESMLMAFLSLCAAILLVELFLPQFQMITGKNLSLHTDISLIVTIVGIAFITGIVAGSYPAFYLSGFKPALVLKGKMTVSSGESWVRKGLVVFQFTISVILIVSVLVIYKQIGLIQTKNLGYNKDNIIHFSNEGKLHDNLGAFLNEVKKIPGVVNATGMNGDLLGQSAHSGGGIGWEGKDPNLGIEYHGLWVNYDFIEMMGLQMKEGRAFSRKFGSDSSKVIFNEAAIAAMGLKDPVGKMVSLWGHQKQIIGVVKDFNFKSLYTKVGPLFLECNENNNNILVKIKAGKEKETIAGLNNFYRQFNQNLPFEYKFLDDDYQALYSSEQRVAILSKYFAGIAIVISCLGLFGLAAFTAQKRQKEIGIRKVVGASVSNLVMMLSKDFLKLVLISVLIAFPISWWAMHQWLQGFAYRVHINAFVFVLAFVSIVLITLLTISFQSIKAAMMNPVKSLKNE